MSENKTFRFPSEEDYCSGIPFSGFLGEILQRMLINILVKCKPPAGRLPSEEEINACKQYLLQEIELLKPRLILAFGDLTAKFLLDKPVSISPSKNKPFKYKDSVIIFTYHPSCITDPHIRKIIWKDLTTFKTLYDWILENQNQNK